MTGRLYVVAGPIGNLEDVTLRALRVLAEVDMVLAEDTRITRKLLSRYDIHTPLESCHAHTPRPRIDAFVGMMKEGKSLALLTDAGTPGVSDPGAELVQAAVESGIQVTPIPGPSAVTAMVSVAPVADGRYAFEGFPPRKAAERRALMNRLKREERAVVLYESPLRLRQTIQDLMDALGDCRVVIGRELTKKFEEVHRGTLSSALKWLGSDRPRGEFTLIVFPVGARASEREESSPDAVDRLIREAFTMGMSTREAVEYACRLSRVPRKTAYARALAIRSEHGTKDAQRAPDSC